MHTQIRPNSVALYCVSLSFPMRAPTLAQQFQYHDEQTSLKFGLRIDRVIVIGAPQSGPLSADIVVSLNCQRSYRG